MTFWKDKAGNELTFKEFMARWKSGLEGVTTSQQIKMQMISTWIILFGIVCGIIVTLFALDTVWWLTIILSGALFNTLVQQLGLYQKKKLLSRFNIPPPNQVEKSVTEEEGFPSSFNKGDGGIK